MPKLSIEKLIRLKKDHKINKQIMYVHFYFQTINVISKNDINKYILLL